MYEVNITFEGIDGEEIELSDTVTSYQFGKNFFMVSLNKKTIYIPKKNIKLLSIEEVEDNS